MLRGVCVIGTPDNKQYFNIFELQNIELYL